MQRKKCTIENCQCLGTLHKTIGQKKYYKKYCSKHNKLTYGIKPARRAHNYFFEKLKKNRKNICELCSWIGPTHFHRIIPGKDGGKYELGNVLEICPNCHIKVHKKQTQKI